MTRSWDHFGADAGHLPDQSAVQVVEERVAVPAEQVGDGDLYTAYPPQGQVLEHDPERMEIEFGEDDRCMREQRLPLLRRRLVEGVAVCAAGAGPAVEG